MIKADVIAIQKGTNKDRIGDIIFFLLNNNNYNTALIKDNNMIIKKRLDENININKINDFFYNTPKSKNILIIDNEGNKEIEKIILNNKIDLIVNTIQTQNGKYRNKKKFLYKNLKNNGIVIANSDSKDIFEYFEEVKNNIIVTYGLSSRATLTASSIDTTSTINNNEKIYFNTCVQRGIKTKRDNEIEPMEFPIKILKQDNINEYSILTAVAVGLIYDIPINKIQKTYYEYSRITC